MSRIVLASNNAHKVAELNQLLGDTGLEIIPQSEFQTGDVVEDGLSFVENALIKARHAAKISGLPAIADDSGIEVDALNGAPGIYSARYAGEHGDDQANNAKLLEALSNTPDEQRGARFQCIMVYMRHAEDPTPIICQGTWEGQLLREARGAKGFGYDPLFYVPQDDCSAAELSEARKNQLSHRGQAVSQLIQALQKT